jgi:hypothetical protein
MAVDHERRTPHEYHDYIDRAPSSDASGWGMILGLAALLAILGMLFIGIGNTPDGTQPQPQTTTERTAPTPAPTPAPSTTPAPTTPAAPK